MAGEASSLNNRFPTPTDEAEAVKDAIRPKEEQVAALKRVVQARDSLDFSGDEEEHQTEVLQAIGRDA